MINPNRLPEPLEEHVWPSGSPIRGRFDHSIVCVHFTRILTAAQFESAKALRCYAGTAPHACALRCLGQRWLKILWKMWQTRTHYDAELHQQHQFRHGSWMLKLRNA